MAYANITIPPVRVKKAAKPLVAYLAPIDIDPIHSMDSPLSAPKREYKEMLYKWADVMDGRVVIYDYDQGMLVWRDIPAPSLQAFRHDVKHYHNAGILGVDTESRGAFATTFANLFYRGQLLWDPEADVDALEQQFYKDFYGPAAEPMRSYWEEINDAWEETIVTEHEYHLIPAIYTWEVRDILEKNLQMAEFARGRPGDNIKLIESYAQRIQIARKGFDILNAYCLMAHAVATDIDYAEAVKHGERGLAVREELTKLNGILTTYKNIGEHGAAWWPGEVEQYRNLAKLTNGEKGTLVLKTPENWSFRCDEKDVGVKEGWATAKIELPPMPTSPEAPWKFVQRNRHGWQLLRTDLYLQAQGIITEDHQSYTGHGWYRTEIDIPADQAGKKLHLMFPGLFNECWLYVDGKEVAHRE